MTKTDIGRISAIVRYPVKSMAGTQVESAVVGWHGLAGDRRFAFRRVHANDGFPWLSASRLPELLLYHPVDAEDTKAEPLPVRVRIPTGSHVELDSTTLASHLSELLGEPVEMMALKHGIFDEAPLSVISMATIDGIGRAIDRRLDRRRFRANIVLTTNTDEPFREDEWVGHELALGDDGTGPVVSVTQRDLRCAMINLDPETVEKDPGVLKAVARLNETHAGVYATVVQTGTIRVGDPVYLVERDG